MSATFVSGRESVHVPSSCTRPDSFARVGLFITVVLSTCVTGYNAPGQTAPILQLRPDGPLATIHRLEFSADGSRLYAAGDEKLIQIWSLNDGTFERAHAESLRHWIGPGPLGSLHAMSVSSDGRYIVAGGVGMFSKHAGFSTDGIMIPSMAWSRETFDEVGTLSLFDMQADELRKFKTHAGYVLAAKLITMPGQANSYLITVGVDETPDDCGNSGPGPSDVARSVRVFRIADGKQLARWPIPETKITPTLTVWSVPNATDETGLRITVTLANLQATDELLLLRPRANPMRIPLPACLAADQIGNTQELCVTAYRSLGIVSNGRLQRRIDLSAQTSEREVIYSLATIRSRPSLAVLTLRDLQQREDPSQHRLQVVDLKTGRFLLGDGIPIGNRQNPVIAVDPRGRYIAATADVTKGVQIFELRPERADPQQWPQDKILKTLQELKPDFQPIQRGGVVDVDGKKVLRIQTERGASSQWYDLINGALRPTKGGPNSFDTVLAFKQDPASGEFSASVTLGNSVGQIKVKSSFDPIGKLVESKVLNGRPLAAVAYLQYSGESQTILALYDPATGREIRRLNGHQQNITGIEFSEDHQFLTSVSADGMVCVWSLRDLTKLVGRRGAIHDVHWCLDDLKLTISRVDVPMEASGIRPGDKVIGIIDGNDSELFRYDSPEEFFRGVSRHRPNSKVRIRVSRSEREIDVLVKLGQVADERKPLFSFISRYDPRTKQMEWLAWTPSGPFQSSGPGIEQRAGWHFNPVREGERARFAPFAEYRDQFSGDGLLTQLLALGRLPDVWPPLASVELSARFIGHNGEHFDATGNEYLIDAPPNLMQVAVTGVPARFVSSVAGDVDGARNLEFSRSEYDPEIWVCELQGALKQGQQHVVSVLASSVRLREGAQGKSWIVVPPPVTVSIPRVRLISHETKSEVRKSELGNAQRVRLEATVGDDQIPADFEFMAKRNGSIVELSNISIQDNRVSGWVPVVLGSNRLAMMVKHGDEVEISPPIDVVVIDPPSIASIEANVDPKNNGQLDLVIHSSQVPAKRDIRLLHGRLPIDGWSLTTVTAEPGLHRVTIADFAVGEGPNPIGIQLINAAGQVWEQRDVTLTGVPRPLQPKLDLFLGDGAVFESSEIEIMAEVISRDLAEIRCQVGDHRIPIAIPSNDGESQHLISMRLPIDFGLNHITVSAISRAGLVAVESRVVTRIELPIELVVQRIKVAGNAQIEVELRSHDAFSALSALPAATGNVEGYVRFSSSSGTPGDGAMVVRAWVNGFLQSVVSLTPSEDEREFRFSIPVLLSSTENDIRLDLPGLVEAESTPVRVTANCDHPSYDQTLYLLVVSRRVSSGERNAYEKSVLKLLGVKNGRMPAFSRVVTGNPRYPAQTGPVSSDVVRPLFRQVRFDLSQEQASNNTVLLYFQGEELRSESGQICLVTSDVRPARAFTDESLITSKFLGDTLNGLKCANLLFLDVTQHANSAEVEFAGDPAQPGLGVLRLVETSPKKQYSSSLLMEQVRRVIPRVGDLGQLALELKAEAMRQEGLAVNESIPPMLRRMRFGESLAE